MIIVIAPFLLCGVYCFGGVSDDEVIVVNSQYNGFPLSRESTLHDPHERY